MSEDNTRLTREQIAAADFESLMLDPKFRRFLYTIFETAGMFASDFHSESRIHAFGAGRRSLGLDILRTAQSYAGPEALLLILSEEMKTQKEAPSGNRKSDYIDKRRAELGGPDDIRPEGTGLVYLDYSGD